MKNKSSNLKKIAYILVPVLLILLVFVRLKNNKEISQNKVYQFDKNQPIYVSSKTIQLEETSGTLSFPGTFEAQKETKLSAESQGKINQMYIEVGSHVRKGQLLIQLDNALLKLQLESADVQIEQLQADVNRFIILADADAIQKIQLEKAQFALKAAKIQRSTLIEQVNKTSIKAPFDGIITAKLTEVGAFAAPGVPLLQLSDIATLRFTVNVSERDLSHFVENKVYNVTADAFPSLPLSGKAILIGSKATMGSSFPIQLDVKNTATFILKSGMFGKVMIHTGEEEMGILIPSSAIVGTSSKRQVYVIKNDRATLQTVKIGHYINNKAVILSGLTSGDQIVTKGLHNLYNGAKVKINN